MQLTLGPLLYCFDKENMYKFYDAVAKSKISIVYLGETVCSRRRTLTNKDYLEIGEMLVKNNKQVIFSTPTLTQKISEYKELDKLIKELPFGIEANDMGAVQAAINNNRKFKCGPNMNIYNIGTIKKLASLGMESFVMPIELSKKWLCTIKDEISKANINVEIEVFAHGYMPLSYSARCFTSKHVGVQKSKCDIACLAYPTGIIAKTMGNDELLRLNGVQIQSAQCLDLTKQIPDMKNINVDFFRISATSIESIDNANKIIEIINGHEIKIPASQTPCNGYWFGKEGFTYFDK